MVYELKMSLESNGSDSPENSFHATERHYREICARIMNRSPGRASKKKLFSNYQKIKPTITSLVITKPVFSSSTPMVRHKENQFIPDDLEITSISSISEKIKKQKSRLSKLLDGKNANVISLSSTGCDSDKSSSMQQNLSTSKSSSSQMNRRENVRERVNSTNQKCNDVNNTSKSVQTSKIVRNRSASSKGKKFAKNLCLRDIKEKQTQTSALVETVSQNASLSKDSSYDGSDAINIISNLEKDMYSNNGCKSLTNMFNKRKSEMPKIDVGGPWRAPSGIQVPSKVGSLVETDCSSDESFNDTFRPKMKKGRKVFINKRKLQTKKNAMVENKSMQTGQCKLMVNETNLSALEENKQKRAKKLNADERKKCVEDILQSLKQTVADYQAPKGLSSSVKKRSVITETSSRNKSSTIEPVNNVLLSDDEESARSHQMNSKSTYRERKKMIQNCNKGVEVILQRLEQTVAAIQAPKTPSSSVKKRSVITDTSTRNKLSTIEPVSNALLSDGEEFASSHQMNSTRNKMTQNFNKDVEVILQRLEQTVADVPAPKTPSSSVKKRSVITDTSTRNKLSTIEPVSSALLSDGEEFASSHQMNSTRNKMTQNCNKGVEVILQRLEQTVAAIQAPKTPSSSVKKRSVITDTSSRNKLSTIEPASNAFLSDGEESASSHQMNSESTCPKRKKITQNIKVHSTDFAEPRRSKRNRRPVQKPTPGVFICGSVNEFKSVSAKYPLTSRNTSRTKSVKGRSTNASTRSGKENLEIIEESENPHCDDASNSVLRSPKPRVQSGRVKKSRNISANRQIRRSELRSYISEFEGETQLVNDKCKNTKWLFDHPKKLKYENIEGMSGVSSAISDGNSMGFLKIEAGNSKTKQTALNHEFTFFVLEGEAAVGVGNEESVRTTFESFCVPAGGHYFIKNTSKKKPLLLIFTKIPKLT